MKTSQLCDSALNGYIRHWSIIPDHSTDDIRAFLDEVKPEMTTIFNDELERLLGLKYWTLVRVTMAHLADETYAAPATFRTRATVLLNITDVAAALQITKVNLVEEMERKQEISSDWVISHVDSLEIHVVKYQPLRASSFKTRKKMLPLAVAHKDANLKTRMCSFKKLPHYIQHKKAIINPQNRDQKCFAWAILAALHPSTKNPQRVKQYEKYMDSFYSELNFVGIKFPVAICDIPKFESQNDVSVNVFTFEPANSSIYPVYRTKNRLLKHVNLFVYDNHYSWILNLDRFFSDQNGHRSRLYYCDMCLFPFMSQNRLLQHQEHCGSQDPTMISMPGPGRCDILRFAHIRRTLRRPMVAYVDLASVISVGGDHPEGEPSPDSHQRQKHELCSYALVLARSCCGKSVFEDITVTTGKPITTALMETLIDVAEHKLPQHKVKPLAMTPRDNKLFAKEKDCSLCMKPFGKDKVRDHCHICGRYRQALHAVCNQQLCHRKRLPVVIHNLQRYGSNMILRSISDYCTEKDLKITFNVEETHPLTHDIYTTSHEDYMKFTVHGPGSDNWRIEFIDAMRFLRAPFEKLAETLPFEKVRSLRQFLGDEDVSLLKQMDFLPCGTIDSWETLLNSRDMTPDEFPNKLFLAEENYGSYLNHLEQLGIRNLRNYVETSIKSRVLLLADAFENFRDSLMDAFSIDPSTYNTLLGLGWDACLKLTGVELELITDPVVYNFVEAGIRGSIVQSSRRSAKANNPYVESYNPHDANRYITCLHSNNHQAGAMMSPLPTGKFRFLQQEECENFDVSAVDPDGPKGYILECDLDYPGNLNDLHNCYPLAPEKLELTTEMLSAHSAELLETAEKNHTPLTKLVARVQDKRGTFFTIRTC